MGAATDSSLTYLGRTRLHRSQANLIQTLQTCAAFQRIGIDVDLHLPPWPRSLDIEKHMEQMGISTPPALLSHQLLHPRFHFRPFVWRYRHSLKQAPALYTRVVEISLALAQAGLPNHLEIHDARQVHEKGQIHHLVRYHREGRIGWLFPISHTAAASLSAAGAVPDRIHVAPSGVDLNLFNSIKPFDPSRLNRPRLVYLGRISNTGGLRVFTDLAGTGQYDITLIGRMCDPVENSRNITLIPFIPPSQVPDWYERTDICLLPYQLDLDTVDSMSPVKLFEAMAAGRPIIASDLPTLREVIDQDRTGLLVPPNDTHAWQAAIERLRNHPDLAADLARNARHEATRFSWDQRANGIARALKLIQ